MGIKHERDTRNTAFVYVRYAACLSAISCDSHSCLAFSSSLFPLSSLRLRFVILAGCPRPNSLSSAPVSRINVLRFQGFMNSNNGSQTSTTTRYSPTQRSRVPSIHWLFRSNIPRKRASYISIDVQKRNFFGMGEIIGVITNVCSCSPDRKGLFSPLYHSRQKPYVL